MRSPIKWHGGKYFLAPEIVARIPPHKLYVEPFFGSGAVLFAKQPGAEIINDLDGDLVNFWRVLADETSFSEFARRMQCTPFSRQEWDDAAATLAEGSPVDRAVKLFVHVRQSFSAMRNTWVSGLSIRPRRNMHENASAWLSAVDGLAEAHERLRGVVVECAPALRLVETLDQPEVFFYLDPPYLPDTRECPGVYACEMTERDHRELLTTIRSCSSKILLSGYPSKLYDTALASWNREEFVVEKRGSKSALKTIATEVLWRNY